MYNNYCVYVYKDSQGAIRYVGQGRPDRVRSKQGRSPEFLEFINCQDFTVEILHENLTKDHALAIESNLIQRLDNLLNKNSTAYVNDLTYDFCREYFYFDINSPTLLRWNKTIYSGEYRNVQSTIKHSPAGNLMSKGYNRVTLTGRTFYVHRILWVLYHGEDIPKDKVINHIDGNRVNNSIENLELCTQQQNCARTIRKPAGLSGVVGVSIKTSTAGIKSYYATVRFHGKLYEKGFSQKKYGEEIALLNAVKWREDKIKELNNIGEE